MPDELNAATPAGPPLPAADVARIAAVAADVVALYGQGGPPFPITRLLELLEPTTLFLPPRPAAGDRHIYGYAFPIDFAVYHKHAALYLDSTAPTREVFITAFHEAGHVLLHILPDRLPDAAGYTRRPGAAVPGGQAEVEADLFARLTTMPEAWVRARWPAARACAGSPPAAVAALAAAFAVPPGWMQRRLAELGLLPPAPR